MGFPGEHELDGELLVVNDFRETFQIGEQQVCTFVCGKTTCKTNDKRVGVNLVDNLHHCRGITLVGKPFGLEIAFYEIDEFVLERASHVPDFLILDFEDTLPVFRIIGMFEHLCPEFFHVELLPFRSSPCRHVDAVGNIAHMAFLPIVAFPDSGKHFL